jgi:molybdate transport system substrate-binding protein
VTGGRNILRSWIELLAIAACILSTGAHGVAQEREIRIAAAADLKFAMAQLAEQFEKETGTRVNITYGSSGNFFSQIQNGAPFDLFFSADVDYAKKLEAIGFAEPGTLYTYAVGRIVIWMPPGTKLDVTKGGWTSLLDASVQKIAIANPEHAPYGRAAVAALQKAGIYEQVKSKLVYGENISQAAQFVQSGNAQAGIIARSLAVSPGMSDGKTWDIPAEMHPPIEQAAILLTGAKNKKAARAFLDFVESAAGREILLKFGFAVPAAAKP